ncbi:MAG: alpha/beta hydrolase [Ruminococcaceae bacterium]|nr:alpha/beta hydrolase [Oscillospiraceae bacterium]
MKKKITLVIIVVLIASLIGSTVYYINDYYHADEMAVSLITAPKTNVIVTEENGAFTFKPRNATKGIIFYPGGKVQAESYAPLMHSLAENGILSVLVTMPGNLAVLDMNAAEGIYEKYPEIESWYMAGHSLGGSMAASYIAENSKDFDGIILLASYSTADLSNSGLDVISIYGTNDGVLNMEKYEEYKPNLPEDFKEVVINGGCHAYFGAYGEQEGDKKATITREEQIEITVKEILQFINN